MIQQGTTPKPDMDFLSRGGVYSMAPSAQNPKINTSVTPRPVYTPEQTQHTVNQSLAMNAQQYNPAGLMHQQDRGGVSRSAGSYANILPQLVQGQTEAAFNAQAIPFQDAAANAQSLFAGQQARSNEFQGLAQQSLGMQNIQNQFYNAQLNQLLPLLLGGF